MTENKSLNMHLNIRCSSAESQFFQADVILTNHNLPPLLVRAVASYVYRPRLLLLTAIGLVSG